MNFRTAPSLPNFASLVHGSGKAEFHIDLVDLDRQLVRLRRRAGLLQHSTEQRTDHWTVWSSAMMSDETKHLIDTQVRSGYDLRQTATRLPDGHWAIPVDDDVFDHLVAARLPGETDDDLVSRLLRKAIGKIPN